jgi:hypothetical protein
LSCHIYGSMFKDQSSIVGPDAMTINFIPRRLTTLIRWKILDSAVDVVSKALSMHVAPPAIQIVVVHAGVTILLGLCNPPYS